MDATLSHAHTALPHIPPSPIHPHMSHAHTALPHIPPSPIHPHVTCTHCPPSHPSIPYLPSHVTCTHYPPSHPSIPYPSSHMQSISEQLSVLHAKSLVTSRELHISFTSLHGFMQKRSVSCMALESILGDKSRTHDPPPSKEERGLKGLGTRLIGDLYARVICMCSLCVRFFCSLCVVGSCHC